MPVIVKIMTETTTWKDGQMLVTKTGRCVNGYLWKWTDVFEFSNGNYKHIKSTPKVNICA